jgi:hypothetical protein
VTLTDYCRQVFEHSSEGVALISLSDYTLLDVNRVLTEMMGLPKEQIVGKPCHEVFHHFLMPCAVEDCPVEILRGGEFMCEALHMHNGKEASGMHVRAVKVDETHALCFYCKQSDLFHQAEELEALQYISSLVHRTLSVDEVIHTILTAVTAHQGLAFHRAFLFQLDEKEDALVGTYAVGPVNQEEAFRIWSEIQGQNLSLMDLLKGYRKEEFERTPIQQLVRSIRVPLDRAKDILVWTFVQGVIVNLTTDTLPQDLSYGSLDSFGARRCVLIPIHSAIADVGILVADNTFSPQVIEEKRVKSLAVFASEATTAMVNSMMFENIKEKSKALEEALGSLKASQEKLVLAERLSTVGQLSAQIAHEIRNPLVSIGLLAHKLARSRGLTPDEHLKVEEMEAEVHRLERLLNDLLDFSAQPRPKFKPTDLAAVLRSLLILIEDEFSRKGIRVTTYWERDLPLCLLDPDQIRHVFLNLFRNAMNILSGGGKVSVEAVSLPPDRVRVSITDDGPGIPEGIKDQIFTPFFTTSSVGTGLGLAIAARIIDDHEGQISVDSIPGQGTTFHIDLKALPRGFHAG